MAFVSLKTYMETKRDRLQNNIDTNKQIIEEAKKSYQYINGGMGERIFKFELSTLEAYEEKIPKYKQEISQDEKKLFYINKVLERINKKPIASACYEQLKLSLTHLKENMTSWIKDHQIDVFVKGVLIGAKLLIQGNFYEIAKQFQNISEKSKLNRRERANNIFNTLRTDVKDFIKLKLDEKLEKMNIVFTSEEKLEVFLKISHQIPRRLLATNKNRFWLDEKIKLEKNIEQAVKLMTRKNKSTIAPEKD